MRGLFALAATAAILLASGAEATTVADYSFNGSLADSSGNGNDATVLYGAPGFTADVPVSVIPQTGVADTGSLVLTTNDALKIAGGFPFDTLPNATLEFWLKPAALGSEQDLFWTTDAPGVDANRFNMLVSPTGTFYIDYRNAAGTLHGPLAMGYTDPTVIPAGQWSFVAVVKQGNTYSTYVNNVLESQATDSSPDLPTSGGWTLSGRGQEQYSGLLNGLLISDQALTPAQFEDSPGAIPEPVSAAILLTAMAGLASATARKRLRK